MVWLLCGLCAALGMIVIVLLCKIAALRRAAGEIGAAFCARLDEDSNVGIDVSTADRRMRCLAAEIDRQLKRLRRRHIRFTQGDRELKDAVTNIAHDLRTPLTAICGYMELLEQKDVPEDVRKYLQIIENRVDVLKQLTEELFRYSVIVSTADDSRETIIMNHALEECIAAHYSALLKSGIEPEISIPDTLIERSLNKASFFRILDNMMGNVLKYSDGDLYIALSPDGAIIFRNHSKYLNEIRIGRLFDRFYTVENGQGGTGLGLSIAKILTEQMGGTIQAYKEGEVFTIELVF
ncbi:MAG: HAMP domain-containing sensor histidine kinase [Christensenella sp.]|uniref:sensor histidine kinase n=1 Tax=Christensenella sp. TaxID=1935934 RepID=UPI002B21CC17|nr:HAMP domain-containing sensor histidine kinase [Christensenella sp.]MEA5004295.1 HAMP domain-containing sensor histidine kinase [Christensenella sp.]